LGHAKPFYAVWPGFKEKNPKGRTTDFFDYAASAILF
jgi:hypothetical protein